MVEPEAHGGKPDQEQKRQHRLLDEGKPGIADEPLSAVKGHRSRQEKIEDCGEELQVSAQAAAGVAGLAHAGLRTEIEPQRPARQAAQRVARTWTRSCIMVRTGLIILLYQLAGIMGPVSLLGPTHAHYSAAAFMRPLVPRRRSCRPQENRRVSFAYKTGQCCGTFAAARIPSRQRAWLSILPGAF